MRVFLHGKSLEIRNVAHHDLQPVLQIYRQCEDFLRLGPEPTASMAMVLKDIGSSRREGGMFCCVFTTGGQMIGVVDFVPQNFEGNPQAAFLSLLMIASPFRRRGFGTAVVELVEDEIKRDARITILLAGVQVNNPQARQFWQKMGYGIAGKAQLQPDRTIAFRLRKDIGRLV